MIKTIHKVVHNNLEYEMSLVKCDETTFGVEDHGMWTALVSVTSGSWGTSIGGFRLDDGGEGTAAGLDWLINVVNVIDPSFNKQWENIKGKEFFTVHLPGEKAGFQCKGILSLDQKRIFMFDEWRKKWYE